jgi:putative transposase
VLPISNRRLISLDESGVTFPYKDYCRDGAERYRTMTLGADEFIRRFLLHVLPKGFHRIRHCGLLASASRTPASGNCSRCRRQLSRLNRSNQPIQDHPVRAVAGA